MLKIHNSLSGEKEEFKPLLPNEVRMYVCGMTNYDYIHVGHARMLVAFDLVQRYLRSLGYKVTYVRNVTDIDDKISASRWRCTRIAKHWGFKSRIWNRGPRSTSVRSST
jgi:cysteinyl-tRNA synthetase